MAYPIKDGSKVIKFWSNNTIETGSLLDDGRVELLDCSYASKGEFMDYPASPKLFSPSIPMTTWCVGLNYREHAHETGLAVPEEPCIFMKPNGCTAAHGETIEFPSWAGRVDYEGELAIVIGKHCKNVSEERALDYVLGYTCLNDVTARELQIKDGQWTRAKSFDKFAPMGPSILVTRRMPPEARLTTRLNGKVVQTTLFSDMIFDIPRIISHISRFATLSAGDVIATGTPSGIGQVHDGDEVEVEIDGIGILKNRFKMV